MHKLTRILYFIIKRIFDIICSIIGIFFLIIITFIVKIIYICHSDYSSIFYSQTRIGKNGKKFKLYKFRTMIPDADDVLKKLLKQNKYKTQWNKNHKIENDPRITKIGNLLRKTSLDELPQLINVFKGEMSMIGPRPLVEGELDSYNGNHKLYESVKPGITGWWGCNGRSDTTYEKRLKLEYYYVKNCSLMLDIKIFFKTIIKIIKREGAI